MATEIRTTTTARKPLARELAALTDAELDQYLQEHNRVVIVEDPHQLPESFIERLRDRTRQKAAPAIDLEQVNARLLTTIQEPTPPQEHSFRSSRSPTRSPSPIENSERQQYEELVRLGGRPCYPVDLVDDVFRNPTKYRDMLVPFLTTLSDWNCPIVFTKQVGRWDLFRGWQSVVRRNYRRHGRAYLPLSEEGLRAFQAFKRTQKDSSLTAYANAIRRTVLDCYGLRYTFKPLADHLQQDELSTWLEYLGYNHWVSEYCKTREETYRKQYDKAWATLLSLDVLSPSEVQKRQIEDDALQTACRKTESKLEEDVKSAEAALLRSGTANEEHNASFPAPNPGLDGLKARLERVRARLCAIDNFLGETMDCRAHLSYWEMLARTYAKELPWILQ